MRHHGFKEYDRYTVSEFLNDALNKKGFTIDNIYEAFQKNKSKEIRNTTKKEIENWFKGKSYPNLNQMYQMAYIIPIDPAYLWKIKTYDEKKMRDQAKNRIAIGNLLTQGMGDNELLFLSILYSFIFVSFLFFALSVRSFFTAFQYNEDQSIHYTGGAIDESVEKFGSNEVVNSYFNSIEQNTNESDKNGVKEMREKFGNSSNSTSVVNTSN